MTGMADASLTEYVTQLSGELSVILSVKSWISACAGMVKAKKSMV
jgi:hypothetical protein